ncbi:MAG: hypothetical protein ACTMIY_11040 [Microbacterium gubbeenense]
MTTTDRPEWGDVQITELLDRANARLTTPRIGRIAIRETDHDLIVIRNLTQALTHTRAALAAVAATPAGPSAGEVEAAAKAMYGLANELSMSGARDLARAALLAAQESHDG